MRRFLVIYALSGLLTTMAYADAYQLLLDAYNDRQSAENLYAQIGKKLSKRVATNAERSNLSFIAIYGGVAKWDSNGLVNKLDTLTNSSSDYINEAPLALEAKRYRTEHYVNLVVLCVASHLSSEKQTLANPQDIIQAIQDNIDSRSMHSDVFNRLQSLNPGDIQEILKDYDFENLYILAKEYAQFDESTKNDNVKMPGNILLLSRDQAIQYQEALLKINELNKDYEARKITVPTTAARPPLKAVFPTAETGDSKVSSEKDDGNRQKSMVLASGESDEIIIEGTEGVWVHHKIDGSLSNDRGPLVFSDGDWEQATDGAVIIRGNIHANRGGMILATGKYIPAPPPPAPRATPPLSASRALVSPPPPPPFSAPRALVSPPPPPPVKSNYSPMSEAAKDSSVTPKKSFLDEIVGAKLRATPQKTEEQKRAEKEKKEKEIVAQKEIDAINVEIKKIENNIIQRIKKRKDEFSKINRKEKENLKNTNERKALTDEINKLNMEKERLRQEKDFIDAMEADLKSKETDIENVSKVINRDTEARKKQLEQEIEELKTNLLGSSNKRTRINNRISRLDGELIAKNKEIADIDALIEQSKLFILGLQPVLKEYELEIEILRREIEIKEEAISIIRKEHGLSKKSGADRIQDRRKSVGGDDGAIKAGKASSESDFDPYSDEDEDDSSDDSDDERVKKERRERKSKEYEELSKGQRKEFRDATRLRRGQRKERLRLEAIKEEEERKAEAAKREKEERPARMERIRAAQEKAKEAEARALEEMREKEEAEKAMLDKVAKLNSRNKDGNDSDSDWDD